MAGGRNTRRQYLVFLRPCSLVPRPCSALAQPPILPPFRDFSGQISCAGHAERAALGSVRIQYDGWADGIFALRFRRSNSVIRSFRADDSIL